MLIQTYMPNIEFLERGLGLQSWTQYFETFFTKFSFHHKWNKAWLIVINMVYTICLTSCRTTEVLKRLPVLRYFTWKLEFVSYTLSMIVVSPPNFVNDFSKKIYLMLYSINWPNLIVWLHLLLEKSTNMCIVIVCLPGYDIIN